jgi:hypothetical protein
MIQGIATKEQFIYEITWFGSITQFLQLEVQAPLLW